MAKRKRHSEYVRVTERPPDLIDPLDYLILAELPFEGTLMGGYYPVAATVTNLRKQKFPDITSTAIGGRVRAMQFVGLTAQVKVSGASSHHGWQITKKGREVLKAWQQRQAQ